MQEEEARGLLGSAGAGAPVSTGINGCTQTSGPTFYLSCLLTLVAQCNECTCQHVV